MLRKLALALLVLVACVVVALAALPWWLGAALGAAGPRFGATFETYQKIGYTRFALTDVKVVRPGLEVNASRVEVGTPLLWLFKRPGEVEVWSWSVTTAPVDDGAEDDKTEGWVPLRERLEEVVSQLERWLPPARAGAGEIAWPGGELRVSGAVWTPDEPTRLTLSALSWREQVADVEVKRLAGAATLVAEAHAADEAWDISVESDGPRLSARGRWWGQPVVATARFEEEGWLPAEARVEASGWTLPASRLRLDSVYQEIAGRARIDWSDEGFSLDAQAAGQPVDGGEAPPLNVVLRGAGGLDRLTIERLDVQVPGVDGRLSEPMVIGHDGRLESGESRFDLVVDLGKQRWFAGSGRVSGVARVTPRDDGLPLVNATLTSDGATVAEWTASKAAVEASLDWPMLSVETATVMLAGGDELTLSGRGDVQKRSLENGRVHARVSRATAERWLPDDSSFETLEMNATASGEWPTITHEGGARATGLRAGPLKPLALDVEWKGEGAVLSRVTLDATAGSTRVRASGAVGEDAARIEELSFTQDGAERLKLTEPVRVQWAPSLALGELRMTGTDGLIAGRLAWGGAGAVELEVKGFESVWLSELVELPKTAWSVTSLALTGRWDEGPLMFKAEGAGVLHLEGQRSAEVAFSAQGDGNGLRLEALRASMEQRVVARAEGNLPVTVHPAQTPVLRIDERGALALDAATEPHAFFWEQLSSLVGLAIIDPQVRIVVGGTAREPVGEATVNVAKLTADREGRLRAVPDIEWLDARVTADRAGVALDAFTMKVAGQTIHASGRLPVEQWAALLEDPLALARSQGQARIHIPDAEVAALARYAPAYLAPTGRLEVDVSLRRGGELEGVIRLKDAASRPLGPLGTLQAIGAEIVLSGRTVEFKELRASAGGQPVTLSGTVALPKGGEPKLNLTLRGERLPFVRQAGMLMRGDLDLRIVTGEDNLTRITGTTRLRESFFLMDVRALIPAGGPRSAPGRRPPYFSVDVLPFSDWLLDVAVDGDRFMRLRTPVFNGLTSARFRLGGTLGEPRAVGEAVVNEGRVLLPFATFEVRQGDVRLTETNPYEPRIALIGTSRRFGYDLRMELRGTAAKPELTFTSTPPLESEQVLLMVMTGETPQNEVSYSGRERATRLGAYLGQSLLRQLGGDPEATERLSISVGERISRQGRETYNAEYRLSPRWSLVGEYDEFDEYNVGVKWRVWSEKKPEETNDDASN